MLTHPTQNPATGHDSHAVLFTVQSKKLFD